MRGLHYIEIDLDGDDFHKGEDWAARIDWAMLEHWVAVWS